MEASRGHHGVLLSLAFLVLVIALLRLHPAFLHPHEKEGTPVVDRLPELAVELGGVVPQGGIYFLQGGSCLADLLEKAKTDAKPESLSLCQRTIPLRTGTSVAIERDERGAPMVSIRPMEASKRYLLDIPIDLNTATVEELEVLPGIGRRTATAIVGFRNRRGPFVNLSELERVPRMGPKRIEALSRYLTVHSE